VQHVTKQSIAKLLAAYQRKGYAIAYASLVVGSQIDPATVANPHIRAHALESQLFRLTLEQALSTHGIRTAVLLERDGYDIVAARLKKPCANVRLVIQDLARSGDGSWRAEQKLAALGACLGLAASLRWERHT
jgi:hypothetical protein